MLRRVELFISWRSSGACLLLLGTVPSLPLFSLGQPAPVVEAAPLTSVSSLPWRISTRTRPTRARPNWRSKTSGKLHEAIATLAAEPFPDWVAGGL